MSSQIYKLSPSDFAYLYEECKLCYWYKTRGILERPRTLMPGVFTAINSRIQGNLIGKNLKNLAADLPDTEIVSQEGFIESGVIPQTFVFIKGKYDLLAKNPDGTHTVIDLKLSQPGEDKVEKYATQLHAYKYAFENPKSGNPIKVSRLALLIFYPDQVIFQNGKVNLDFPHTWMEVPLNDGAFLEFIKTIDVLLKGSEPPQNENCAWCLYRSKMNRETSEDIPF